MKNKERHFHKSFYEILEKCTKAELITRLEDSDKEVRKERWKLDMSGEYQIRILKNKKEVQELNFTWDDNPHGARWDEVKDLEHSLHTGAKQCSQQSSLECAFTPTRLHTISSGQHNTLASWFWNRTRTCQSANSS